MATRRITLQPLFGRAQLLILQAGLVALAVCGTAGCSIIAASDNSQWTKDEAVTLQILDARPTATSIRFISLHNAGSDEKFIGAGAAAGAAIPLVIKGAGWAYDKVVESIEEEAALYSRSYTSKASLDDFFLLKSEPEIRLKIKATELEEWLQSVPVSGAAVPDSVAKLWAAAIEGNSSAPKVIDFSDVELGGLRRLYAELQGKIFELLKAGAEGVALPEEWTLVVRTFEMRHRGEFRFERLAESPSTKKPTTTIRIAGGIRPTESRGRARVELDSVWFRAAAAKVPKDRWWFPGDWVDDELEENLDLVISVRVEHAFLDDAGLLTRETLLDEPVAQLNGLKLNGELTGKWLRQWGKPSDDPKEPGPAKFKSREFLLPTHRGVYTNGLEYGSLTISLTVDETNKAGDYLRKAAEEAKQRREDLLKKMEERLNEVAASLEKQSK